MYKTFDMPSAELDRQPELSVEFIPGAVLSTIGSAFRLLQYPRLEGTWTPTFGGHLRAAVVALRAVHKRDIVHGDIRLCNFVFSTSDDEHRAHLIDFDLSRPAGSAYPAELRAVSDTRRHPVAANRNGAMHASHDCFSLRFLLRQFKPCDKSRSADFRAALCELDAEHPSFLRYARKALAAFENVEIKMRRAFASAISAAPAEERTQST